MLFWTLWEQQSQNRRICSFATNKEKKIKRPLTKEHITRKHICYGISSYTTERLQQNVVTKPNMYTWQQSAKTVLRKGKKSKEHFYCTSQSSKKAIVVVVEVLFRGRTSGQKISSCSEIFCVIPKYWFEIAIYYEKSKFGND